MSETPWPGAPADESLAVRWGSATDVGHYRSTNEDSHLAAPPVFVVADGMGGHARGDEASRRAIAAFEPLVGRPGIGSREVVDAVREAAAAVVAIGGPGAPGTTVAGVALTLRDGAPCWLVFNVGDSRTYRYAGGHLEQVSVDHTRVQELVDEGRLDPVLARFHEERNVITRALGAGLTVAPPVDQWLIPAAPGERMLVCSDGLNGELDDEEIAEVLVRVPDPQDAAAELVRAAVEAGGRDNVTVVVVDTPGDRGGEQATDGERTDDESTREIPVVRISP